MLKCTNYTYFRKILEILGKNKTYSYLKATIGSNFEAL